jgi:hypothetical protein
LKLLVTVGGTSTAIDALAVPPVPPLVELTLPVVLVLTPAVVLVTLPVTVQLAPTPRLLPLTVKPVEPTAPPVRPPKQVVPRAVDTVIPAGNESLTVTPVRGRVLVAGFVMVTVTVEVPVFRAMLAEPKDLVMVGGTKAMTVRVAVAVPPVPPFVEVTLPVVFVAAPTVLSVTVTVTVQLAPPLIVAPLKLMVPEPTVLLVSVPFVQVVEPTEAMVMPEGNVSVTPTPLRVTPEGLGFVMVKVRVEVPPVVMVVGAKALAIDGGVIGFSGTAP